MTNYEAITQANIVDLASYLFAIQKAEKEKMKQELAEQGISVSEVVFCDEFYIAKHIEWLESEAKEE